MYTYEDILAYKTIEECKENPFVHSIKIVYPEPEIPNKYGKKKNTRHNRLEGWRECSYMKPIQKGENAWKPNNTVSENDAILKKINGILNKLSVDNFEKLSTDLLDIEIGTNELLENVVGSIFNKAILEPHFGEIYAKLCVCFGNFNIQFRRYLLNKCQSEFESVQIDADTIFKKLEEEELNIKNLPLDECKKYSMLEDLTIRKTKKKNKITGNIVFIGQLFKSQMISEPIIHSCIQTFLGNKTNNNVECLCKLLEITGDKIKGNIEFYIKELEEISQNKDQFDPRHRFMAKDILDLKKNNWVPRKKKQQPLHANKIRPNSGSEKDLVTLSQKKVTFKEDMVTICHTKISFPNIPKV